MQVDGVDAAAKALQSLTAADRSPASQLRRSEDVRAAPNSAPDRPERIENQAPQAAAAERVSSLGPPQAASARVRVDEDTRRVVTQILDENREVIKQIPPEELIDIAARFRQLRGVLFDESV